MGSSSNNHPDYPDPSLLINVSNFVSIKLSASNYQLWKTQMLCFIDNVGLLDFINDTTPSLSPPPLRSSSSNGTMAVLNDEGRRRRLDQRLKGWILGSLSEEVLPTVVGFDTASAVWTALQHSFGPDLQPLVQMKENSEHEAAGIAEEIKDLCGADLKRFVESMTTDQLELQTTEGNTALSVAAMVGNTEAAEILVTKHPSLLYIENCYHSLPMHMAAKYAHEKTLWYLLIATEANLRTHLHKNPFDGQSGVQLLVDVIISGFMRIALHLVKQYPRLAILKTQEDDSPLAAIARKPSAFQSGSLGGPQPLAGRGFSALMEYLGGHKPLAGRVFSALMEQTDEGSVKNTAGIMRIWREKRVHFQAIELVKRLCTEIQTSTDRDSYRLQWEKPIFVAASLGAHEVVEEIVRTFSNEIWSNNEDRNYIILLAVKYRCKKVFKLILENRHRYSFSVARDIWGNNILHIAAKLAPSHTLNLLFDAALQMQSELEWFKEVQKFANPSCKKEKNFSKETPEMVFTKEHSELLVEAKRWMKDTANSSTIAVALIATVVFAAAVTVPGGNNGDNGLPIFSQRRVFKVFYLSNAVSLFLSVTSLITFLSILTSRCAEVDFLFDLPYRLKLGRATLFYSIVSMMISFTSIFYLVFGSRDTSILIIMILLACLPVYTFTFLLSPLIPDIPY